MLSRLTIAAVLSLLAACGEGHEARAQTQPQSTGASANDWTIGPILRGKNYSKGTPLHPMPRRGGGWYVDIPRAPGSIHYVTFPHGPLTGKSRIVMRYRIETAPGVVLHPRTAPGAPTMITPYFQRSGDTWSARGRFEAYRWYATFATQTPLQPGEHRIVAPLSANWTAVQTSSVRTNPSGFRDALENADQVGFVLGGGDGYGHGVFATGPARLILLEFRVE